MKMKYMITFGEHFWKKVNEINSIMSKGFNPIRIEVVDPHTHAARYIYSFDISSSEGPFTKATHMVSILENTLFPFQYSYLGPDVTISVLLQDNDGNKAQVEVYRYPEVPVITWRDYTLKMVGDLIRKTFIKISTSISNFISNL